MVLHAQRAAPHTTRTRLLRRDDQGHQAFLGLKALDALGPRSGQLNLLLSSPPFLDTKVVLIDTRTGNGRPKISQRASRLSRVWGAPLCRKVPATLSPRQAASSTESRVAAFEQHVTAGRPPTARSLDPRRALDGALIDSKAKIPTYVSAGGDRIARRKAMWPGAGSNRRPSDFQSDARTN